jgi:aminoglycoside phosphotransferase (APT) family kinase protein
VTGPDLEMIAFARSHGLLGSGQRWEALAGGVSSDIWHLHSSAGDYCIKRALAQLKVAAMWEAPVERNAFEWAYMDVAERIAPGCVPRPVAHDAGTGLFAMAWLSPDRHCLWKTELLAGRVDKSFAAAVGDLIGRLHKATADRPEVARSFATDANFHSIRLDPYLLETGRRHADLEPAFIAIAGAVATTRRVLVHGDVSPKNILIGPDGPVLLDAECAWFGDPAFDLAFCLNHLVIKARILPVARASLLASFDALAAAYLSHVNWEAPERLEQRSSRLLPALALARVDGRSPVEYLDERQRSELREAARLAIAGAPKSLGDARRLLLS